MSSVSATSGASPFATQGSSASPDLGRDEFLKLLITQLQNQDPTSPQDSSAFAAQLAQFSSVEQLSNISAAMTREAQQLAGLSSSLAQLQIGQQVMTGELANRINLQAASALIGENVQVRDGSLEWSGSGTVPINVNLGANAREVEVTIRNAEGDVVRVIRTPPHAAGDMSLSWDGTDSDGAPLPAGSYTATVKALGDDGDAINAAPVRSGAVERVTIDQNGVSLWINGRRVAFNDLIAVTGPPGLPQAPTFPTTDLPPMP